MFVCPSASPRARTRLSLEGSVLRWILYYSIKMCQHILIVIEMGQFTRRPTYSYDYVIAIIPIVSNQFSVVDKGYT
jgi:hypothetical protein